MGVRSPKPAFPVGKPRSEPLVNHASLIDSYRRPNASQSTMTLCVGATPLERIGRLTNRTSDRIEIEPERIAVEVARIGPGIGPLAGKPLVDLLRFSECTFNPIGTVAQSRRCGNLVTEECAGPLVVAFENPAPVDHFLPKKD